MSKARSRYVDRRAYIKAELAEIDAIVLLAGEAEDLAIRGHLERLAVIRLSGFMEASVSHMINGFLDENASHRVLQFGKRQAKRLPSMSPVNLEQIVGSFDTAWEEQLATFLSTDENRQTLSNLIGARHALAHGSSAAVSSSLLRQYHRIADETVALLQDMFLPLKGSN